MTATYTFDVFSSLDGYGSQSGGDWGGYWGKQGPEFLERRLALYSAEQRMVHARSPVVVGPSPGARCPLRLTLRKSCSASKNTSTAPTRGWTS